MLLLIFLCFANILIRKKTTAFLANIPTNIYFFKVNNRSTFPIKCISFLGHQQGSTDVARAPRACRTTASADIVQ